MAAGGDKGTAIKSMLYNPDVAQETLEFLAPICGYEKTPLVSLEKAVEPLVGILPTVQSYAYVAKQKCRKPADGLSSDESASIMLYTMECGSQDESVYIVLNKTLRSPDRAKILKPWFLYLRLFLNALLRLPPFQGVIHRGVKLDLSNRYTEGEAIVWWGFSSCTTSVEVLKSDLFLGKVGPRTIFNIQCESARDIRKHSHHPEEDEMLLLAATQFEIRGCLDQGDLHIIELKETRPPFPLLQPVPIVVPLSEPTYRNIALENLIIDQKEGNDLNLSGRPLTDQDMEIVAYCGLYINKVSGVDCVYHCRIEQQYRLDASFVVFKL